VRRRFAEGIGGKIAALEEALLSGELKTIQTISHSLAGADMFGLPLLGEAARDLESAALRNRLEDCAARMAQLREIVRMILEEQSCQSTSKAHR
jgi:HPt (histidine-containing phosphotransfer) domain-containing protein